ncbi:MAG: anthranilate phosphoribosyltransferase [Chloroflexi bacterium]|nr:anthranilate phosphoribosyltransferase [Chloroflexota bacterium]MCI0801788.1 anthranilate phosphoribosyltransferase [Chloroflexota bacterium]MCI0828966.1 anthranilate phosphoribosyltransferase [Chloroflexota bacterium]MCI0863415.1 anthranilate phosphoribosyltransferase [Chloroflexota bacterium]MCI0897266.1 anthranilate phosphoribosyltransferase [Chloroflexota bacterium]
MDIREAIDIVVSGDSLSMDDAASVMRQVMSGEATPAQLGSFLTALRLKGETTDEIAGMATVMREFSLRVNVDGMLVDSVGTGGDGLNTFNISTAAAFVAAGAGLKVAKHGNRAASGSCGSADVLEEMGVRIELPPEGVERCIEESGIGFMFAQAFHPSMRHAGPVRREIGIRTVFNILGPLTNPAGAQSMLVGVAFLELGGKMAEVLRLLDTHHSIVVHGEGGLDEMTLSGDTSMWEVAGGKVRNWTLSVADTGLPVTPIEAVRGGDKAANASTMRALLGGEGGPVRDYVLLNSAGVLLVGDLVSNIRDGVQLAAQAIDSGAAKDCMESMIEVSQAGGN